MKTKLLSFLFLCSTFLIFAQHKFLVIPKFNEADLKKENARLKEIVADLVVRYDIVKKSLEMLD